mgnify:FL=1
MGVELHYNSTLQEALDSAGTVVVFAGPEKGAAGAALPAALPAALADAVGGFRKSGLFKGEAGGIQTLPTLGTMKAGYVVLAGIGDGKADALRQAGAAAAKACRQLKTEQVCALIGPELLPGEGNQAEETARLRDKRTK